MKDSRAAITRNVSCSSSAAVTSATSFSVRAMSQRSSGRRSTPAGPATRSENVGRKPSMFPYLTRNPTEFQNVRSLRLISCAGP